MAVTDRRYGPRLGSYNSGDKWGSSMRLPASALTVCFHVHKYAAISFLLLYADDF